MNTVNTEIAPKARRSRKKKSEQPAAVEGVVNADPVVNEAIEASRVEVDGETFDSPTPVEPDAAHETSADVADLIQSEPEASHVDADVAAEGEAMDEILAPDLTEAELVAIEDLGAPEVQASEATPVEPTADPAEATVEEPQATEQPSFDDTMKAISEEDVEVTFGDTVRNLRERADFEHQKSFGTGKDNIQRTIANISKQLATKRAARVMCATNVYPSVINRGKHTGSRYNVYALGKLADVIFGVSEEGRIGNAINLAILRSLFAFRAAGVSFTGDLARAAASDKIRVSDGNAARLLCRHKVSPSTAPTQASSTMQALETLGVVARTGTSRQPVYTLTSNPIVSKIEQVLAKAA